MILFQANQQQQQQPAGGGAGAVGAPGGAGRGAGGAGGGARMAKYREWCALVDGELVSTDPDTISSLPPANLDALTVSLSFWIPCLINCSSYCFFLVQ